MCVSYHTDQPSSGDDDDDDTGPIVGGIIGALVCVGLLIVLIVFCLCYCRQRRRRKQGLIP